MTDSIVREKLPLPLNMAGIRGLVAFSRDLGGKLGSRSPRSVREGLTWHSRSKFTRFWNG